MSEIHPGDYNSNHHQIHNQSLNQHINPHINPYLISNQSSSKLPKNMITIRSDNHQKCALIAYWIIFLILIGLLVGFMFILPKQIYLKTNQSQLKGTNFQNCTNPSKIDNNTGNFTCIDWNISSTKTLGLFILSLDTLNQFYIIGFQITKLQPSLPFFIDQQVFYQERQIIQKRNTIDGRYQLVAKDIILTQLVRLSINSYSSNYVDQQDSQSQQSYSQNQNSNEDHNQIKKYRQFWLYGYDTQTYKNKIAQVGFLSLQFNNVRNMQMIYLTINPQFSIYTIILRIVLFIISIIAAILYIYQYTKIPKHLRIIQQTLLVIQSILLIFFNDPIYSATILKPNGFLQFFSLIILYRTFYSVFVVVNFLVFIFFTWIIFVQRILYQNGRIQTQLINFRKLPYFVILYIQSIALQILFSLYHFNQKPIIPQYNLGTNSFLILQITTLITILIGFIYIVIQYLRICIPCQCFNVKAGFSTRLWRNKIMLFFLPFFIVLSMVLVCFDGYYIFSVNKKLILIVFWACNIYTFYLQYFLSVSNNALNKLIDIDNTSSINQSNQLKNIQAASNNSLNYDEKFIDNQNLKKKQFKKAFDETSQQNNQNDKSQIEQNTQQSQLKHLYEPKNNQIRVNNKKQMKKKNDFSIQ